MRIPIQILLCSHGRRLLIDLIVLLRFPLTETGGVSFAMKSTGCPQVRLVIGPVGPVGFFCHRMRAVDLDSCVSYGGCLLGKWLEKWNMIELFIMFNCRKGRKRATGLGHNRGFPSRSSFRHPLRGAMRGQSWKPLRGQDAQKTLTLAGCPHSLIAETRDSW